jgi:signal transduction histidine kinase/ActR/RegA family two-component response regulator
VLKQRSLAQAFLALQAALTAILAIVLSAQHNAHALAAALAAVVYGAGWAAFRRGFAAARQVVVVLTTALLIVGLREPYLTERLPLVVLVPPIVALMLTSARWIVASALVELIALGLRSSFRSPLLQPLELMVLAMAVSGMVMARRSMDTATARLAAQAERAESTRREAEVAANEAIAERDRATKLEAALLHMQRLDGVGRLAGGVAHDFNNLLTVIGASASMAERALALGRSATDDLNEIHLAVSRGSELTKQLLAFARKQVLVKRGVELNELVSNVERMLCRLIGQGTALSARLSPEPLRVLADAGQIEQVIVNLVINARDAISGPGRIELVTRRVSLLPDAGQDAAGLSSGDYACLEVRDTGVGMTPDIQRQLFEPFFTTKPHGRGTGLGLATSFGIVRQHEGAIRVDSAAGRGTVMSVLLPLAVVAEAALATSGVLPVVERRRVLVVEDEPQVRAIAARALSNAGFEVLQAINGAAALALVKTDERGFDVIVTDVVMPELNGLELARAVRQLLPQVGWVFMSGFPEAMQSAGPNEFTDAAFLSKPFAPQKLVDAVRERVQRRLAELHAHA